MLAVFVGWLSLISGDHLSGAALHSVTIFMTALACAQHSNFYVPGRSKAKREPPQS
jgi:hypothetical protein